MIKRLFLIFLACTLTGVLHAANIKPYVGKSATLPLKLEDLSGVMHDINDYKGSVVVVQFWATYCGPCRKEMPTMNNLMKKMGDVPFKILAVDMGESKEEVVNFVNEVKPEFTILMDPDGTALAAWEVFAAPSNFLLDSSGKIRYTLYGGIEWDSDEIVKLLKSLAL